jgi:threonine dehydratase
MSFQARTALVQLADIVAAWPRVAPHARRTPLLDGFAADGASRLLLKCEQMQPCGAFKIRGAANMLEQLTPGERERGVITYSSGNHGQAVALAARTLDTPATIVMPTTAPDIKVDPVRRLGASVVFEGTTSIERRARAESEAARHGLTMVPPFDHEWIIAGQATLGLEILDQLPDVGLVLVPIGGGGLASGVGAAIKLTRPQVRVVGVEPEGANAMQQSLAAGTPVTIPRSHSIADGLLPVRPGDLTLQHVQAFLDGVVTVSDTAIVAALRWLYHEARLVVEPSGATALAALFSGAVGAHAVPSMPVVVVLSGGNIAAASLAGLLDVGASPNGVR